MTKIAFLLLVALISGCASSSPQRMWDAASIANFPHPYVVYKDKPDGKIIAGFNTTDIKNIINIKERVENAAGPLRTELLIAEGDEPNGFSFAYHKVSKIGINIGMINLIGDDADAMAALIGHELAHLFLEHGKVRQNREENRIVTSTVLSFALAMVGVPIPVTATDAATTTVSRTFSRDEERDADQLGVTYMAQAGFDPWGAVRLQEKLAAISSGSLIPFLSTHPASTERVENMKRLLKDTPPSVAPVVPDKLAVPSDIAPAPNKSAAP